MIALVVLVVTFNRLSTAARKDEGRSKAVSLHSHSSVNSSLTKPVTELLIGAAETQFLFLQLEKGHSLLNDSAGK